MTMRSSKCEKGYIAPHILIDQLTEKSSLIQVDIVRFHRQKHVVYF